MDLPPVPLWRVKSPPCEKAAFHIMDEEERSGTGCRHEAELTSHPKCSRIQFQNPPEHQTAPSTHPPTAAEASRTWHINPGMILWKQDPL